MQRILRGSAALLRATKLDGNGEPTPPVAPITATVTRSDGSTITPTATGIDGNDATATLPAGSTADLDLLTVTWSDNTGATWTSTHELVGGFLFSVADARASDRTLEDQGKYTDADILSRRTEVEQEFEEITGQAFVPRFATYAGIGMGTFIVPHLRLRRIRRLSLDGTAYTAAQLADLQTEPYGVLYAIRRGAKVEVAYEHGWDFPPADLKVAALTRLRQRLNFKLSGIPDRATSWSAETGGTFRLAMPSAHRTGEPNIDAVLERYSVRTPSVA